MQKKVFKVVDKPRGAKAIASRWVCRTKVDKQGNVLKRKARLVAKGFQQREGIDFKETFAAVVKPTSFRILFAIQALLGWKCHQMDVVTAFLNSPLKEEVYVAPPPLYKLPKDKCWKMQKNLYGFKQAPRAWYDLLADKLSAIGFRTSPYDPCVFINQKQGLIVATHVDDLTIFGAEENDILGFKKRVQDFFEMTDKNECSFYLGMHVEQQGTGVRLHQTTYVSKILERFQLQDLPSVSTPCDPNTKLHKADPVEYSASDKYRTTYLSMFGSLNYLPTISRPDLAYAVSLTGRFNANPSQDHMDAVVRVYKYLVKTLNAGIAYKNTGNAIVQGFVDSDYAGCPDTRRSTTGWVFTLAGGPVSWSSKRQATVADSTCEAEYIAAGEAAKEAIWIKGFVNDLKLLPNLGTVKLHVDNTSAIKLAKNPGMHSRTKHIDIKHHFLREKVQDGTISLVQIKGKDNPADIFTKPLGRIDFERHAGGLLSHSQAMSDSGGVLETRL